MTARILVVDDIPANVKLLEARLTAEYFEVLTARDGPEALAVCDKEQPDIVLLDVMMPGMDGFEVCRRLKADPLKQHIPVIMVTALDQASDRVRGLEAGADDFLTKPVDDIALITRVKNATRLKTLLDEMMMRASTGEQLGLGGNNLEDWGRAAGENGHILIVEDQGLSAERFLESLQAVHTVEIESDPQSALFKVTEENYDLLMVSLSLQNFDGLRLCSQLRSLDRTRHLPLIMIVETGDNTRLMRGLEIGVNDYLTRPIDKNEMRARIVTQVKRKRYADHLRLRLEESVEMAITDSLTGLHNRRYMERHMQTLVDEAIEKGKPISVLITDIDYFKSVNDTYGHDAGDAVLKEFAGRLNKRVRGMDLACRYGGEEFVVIMPDTDRLKAYIVAERLRESIATEPFQANDTTMIDMTVSVGIGSLEYPEDNSETILKRADEALYNAKRNGRNLVVTDAA